MGQVETKLVHVEQKVHQVEKAVDLVEKKVHQVEKAVDQGEQKADQVEKTVNQIQNKVDQAKQEGRPGGQGGVSGRAGDVPGREEGCQRNRTM